MRIMASYAPGKTAANENIGGTPELIREIGTGNTLESGNTESSINSIT